MTSSHNDAVLLREIAYRGMPSIVKVMHSQVFKIFILETHMHPMCDGSLLFKNLSYFFIEMYCDLRQLSHSWSIYRIGYMVIQSTKMQIMNTSFQETTPSLTLFS